MAKNRNDFQRLAELRLKESRFLLDAGFPDGAYYLAGYSVECALKACIAKGTKQHDFPDKRLVEKSYTHDVEKLLDAAGMSDNLKSILAQNRGLKLDWETVREWSEQSRYETKSVQDAAALLKAVEDQSGGLLPWIRLRW
jgi:HEPN domain-containing protein